MKKQILLIMNVLVLNIIVAQQTSIKSTNSKITKENYRIENTNNIDINSPFINANYLKNVIESKTSSIIKQLERQVAKYDISKASIFDNSEEANYRVVFKNKQGKLVVTYNNKGKILTSVERYKDIVIPVNLRIAISKEYPEWVFESNTSLIRYNHESGFHKSYKIQISKGNLKKTLRFDE